MSIRTSALVGLALLSFGALRAPLASAEEPPSSSSEVDEKTRAREAMGKGIEAYRAQKYEEARIALERSFQLQPSHDSAGVLGQTYLALGDDRKASTYLAYCVDHYPTGERRAILEKIEAELKESSRRVLELRVFANVNGSAVSVDGTAFGETPLGRTFLDPGEHTVVVTHPDGRSETREVKGRAGQEIAVTVAFETVKVGVAPIGVGVENDAAKTSGAEKPKEAETKVDASRGWHRGHTTVVVGGGMTLAAAGLGLVFMQNASSAQSDADRLGEELAQDGIDCGGSGAPPECGELAAALDSRNTNNVLQGVFFGSAAGLAIATAAVTYLIWPSEDEKETAVRLVPTGGPSGAGLTLVGQF